MSETLDYLMMFARFPFALRRFLRHRLTLDEARRMVHEQMEHREGNFLHIVERSVYGYPKSPYLPLLTAAGCELGDLRTLVKQKGVEGTLRRLRDGGVYVTFEEFKGRKPIVRNGQTMLVTARDFDNPFARHDITSETGGSTGLAMAVNQNLDYLISTAAHRMLIFSAHDLLDIPIALWRQSFPGTALAHILRFIYSKQNVTHWFSPSGWCDSKYWFKYSLATLYMIAWLRAFGEHVPLPETVKPDQALVIARWMSKTLKRNSRCLSLSSVSQALRVSIEAQKAGLDLTGATMWASGEPLTPTKARLIQNSGARCIPIYTMAEAGQIAASCAQPTDVSDLHLFKDILALITYPHTLESIGITVPAFNFTSLLDTAPKILLNVQSDDYGIVEERSCGCELETYGYTTHLREIRSYSKLVGEGTTLIGNEMLTILEEVLPARFGGTPLDYQLREEEDEQGYTRLYLVISPQIEIADEQQVIEVMLKALRASSPMADAARNVWQHAQSFKIKRIEPALTPSGKLLPLHIQRRPDKS